MRPPSASRLRWALLLAVIVGMCMVAARAHPLALVHDWFLRAIQTLMRLAQDMPPPPPPLTLPYAPPPPADQWQTMSAAERLASTRARILPKLAQELAARGAGLALGQPACIRIFKESHELELWLETAQKGWQLFRTCPIAFFSGTLGPKMREGDRQAPEGFYGVVKERLNPASNYHLSFNIGYPNAHDRHHQRTGSHIMVHGSTVSVGCFAMTDPVIEEIYLIVEAALESGAATVPVHAFPFRMTAARLEQARAENSPHLDFWHTLQPPHDYFDTTRRLPQVQTSQGQYRMKE